MDDLQYISSRFISLSSSTIWVLNLVINGWPSILKNIGIGVAGLVGGFKPCYKWMTFNTQAQIVGKFLLMKF